MPELYDAFMETRLFPKNRGATGYHTTGVAARCDLVIHSDAQPPQTHIEHRSDGPIETVFISMRRAIPALETFVHHVLPKLNQPVVIVSGSEDCTFPVQTDHRFPQYPERLMDRIFSALESSIIRAWFVENLVGAHHPKLRPLPLGFVYPKPQDRAHLGIKPAPPIGARPPTAYCAHRVRDGAQWDLRKQLTHIAKTKWSEFTTIPEEEVTLHEFEAALKSHAFAICAEGGGIDPSPKAWHALACGAIPIIRKTSLAPAYAQLPVIFVEDWVPDAITADFLKAQHKRMSQAYPAGITTPDVVRKLKLDYWWSKIISALIT